MQRLQAELIGCLGGDKLHRRALHRFSDHRGVAEHIFRRRQSRIVAMRVPFPAQVMCANAGFHANQARRHVGKPRFDLAALPLLPQHDRATSIEADNVERILANIDAHRDNGRN